MKVFISWSGELSRQVAEVVRIYLPLMLNGTEPFLSCHDISSGARWAAELSASLDASDFGIICLTPENLTSPWLLFEAGALTKHSNGKVCCLLPDNLSPAEIAPPLSQFQARRFEKTEVRLLLKDINQLLPHPLANEQIEVIFDKWWPELHQRYKEAEKNHNQSISRKGKVRPAEDILQEILATVRRLAEGEVVPTPQSGDPLSESVTEATLSAYTRQKFPHLGISDYWQRQFLTDVDLSKYPSLRHIDDAIEAAKPALEKYSKEAPEYFSNGTDYITKALGFIDDEFRHRHPFSEKSLRVFDRYAHLLSTN